MTYNARDHHGILLLVQLPGDENTEDQDETDQQTDDKAAVPSVRLTAVLKCKDIAGEKSYHQACTNKVKLEDLFFP